MKHKYPQFEGMSDMDVIFTIRQVKAFDAPEDAQWLKEAEDELKYRASYKADVSHATHIQVKLPEVITSFEDGIFRMRINWGEHRKDLAWNSILYGADAESIGKEITKALHELQEKNPPVQTNS